MTGTRRRNEPVPHGEPGGAEDTLQDGDVADAAEEGDAGCAGEEDASQDIAPRQTEKSCLSPDLTRP